MALEPSFDNIDDLNPLNPADNDPVEEGDDHLRGIKNALQANITGDATETRLVIAAGGQVIAIAADGSFAVVGFVLSLDSEADAAADMRLLNTEGSILLSQRNSSAAGDFRMIEGDAGGSFVQDWAHFNKGAGVRLLHANAQKILTQATGALVNGTLFKLTEAAANITRVLAQNTVGGIAIEAHSGGNGNIRQFSAGGIGEDIWIALVPNDKVQLNFDGSPSFETRVNGGAILGARFDVDAEADVNVQQIILNSIGGLGLRIDQTSGEGKITKTSSTGAGEANYITMERSGPVTLVHVGVEAIRTLNPNSAGSFNSGGEVKDQGGTFRPIGFQVMPRSDQGAGTRTLTTADAGKRFRLQSGTSILQLGDIGDDCAVNAYVSTATDTAAIGVPGGVTLRYYGGSGGQVDFVGAQNVALKGGAAVTIVQFTSATFEMWGGELA